MPRFFHQHPPGVVEWMDLLGVAGAIDHRVVIIGPFKQGVAQVDDIRLTQFRQFDRYPG